MKRKTIVRQCLICMLVSTATSITSAQEVLDLESCLQAVRNADFNTTQLNITDVIGAEQRKINRLAYLPQLDLNGKASWQSDVTRVEADFPGIDIPSPDQDQYTISADLVQPIYSGGMIHARSAVIDAEVAVSAMQHHLNLQRAEEAATTLFYQVVLQQQLAEVQALLITQLEQAITSLDKNYQAGTVSKSDVLEVQIKQREAFQNQVEALQRMRMSKASLAILMQVDTSMFQIDPGTYTTVSSSLQPGFQNRFELQLVDAQIGLVDAQDKLNKSRYRPSVSLFASAGYGKPGLNFLNDAFDTYLFFGATLKIPLSHTYTGKASREQQVNRLQQESLALTRGSVDRELKLKALRYTSEIAKLESWIAEDDEMITMSEEVVKIGQARLDGGTITTADFLDNLTTLAVARQQKYIHATMLEQNLALLDQLYGSRNF